MSREDRRASLNEAISERFPGITDDKPLRGYQIATEPTRADTAVQLRSSRATAELVESRRRGIGRARPGAINLPRSSRGSRKQVPLSRACPKSSLSMLVEKVLHSFYRYVDYTVVSRNQALNTTEKSVSTHIGH
jgi:hypothetical protein